ncbi:MAG: hypothetical protein LUI06_03015 [Ruminococcus sp.]|nr:hypothetical protein [Ruminococcus sp.]
MIKKKIITFVIVAILILGIFLVAFYFVKKSNSGTDSIMVTIEEANKELENYTFSEHDNLTFDCTVKNTDISKVVTFKSSHNLGEATDEEAQKCKDLIYLISGETVDESMREYYEGMSGTAIYYGENSGGEYYTGGTFITWKHDDADADMNERVVEKVLDPNDDLSGVSYKVSGEDYPVEEAIEYCDDYIEKNLTGYFNDGEELKLTDIAVVKSEYYEDYEYVMHYAHMIDGVAVDDCGITANADDYMHESYFELTLNAKDDIQFFNNRCYYQMEEVEDVKEIIPLSQAEQILSDTLSSNGGYKVSECELKYCCYVESGLDVFSEEYESEWLKGSYTYEPMWSFTLQNYEGQNYEANYLKFRTAYVNAITGEVIYYDMNSDTLERYEYQE